MTRFSPDVPDNILIIKEFLSASTMGILKDFADGQIGVINKVELAQDDGSLEVQRHAGFSSERIYVKEIDETAKEICNEIFGKVIPDHYGSTIECYEYPHIIRYRKGGQYVPHSDAESWDPDKKDWVRTVDRDFSAIVYFNDGFEGGSLYFPENKFRIKPEPGLLVCFPSNGHFVHTAEPVISGSRYAFVTWAMAHGTPRVFDKPRGDVVYL